MEERLRRARAAWTWTGDQRPPFAESPGPTQRSVWDFPRPPRIEPVAEPVRVELAGDAESTAVVLAASERALAVLETAGAPTYYLPPQDCRLEWLERAGRGSWCEWKGRAEYWSLVARAPGGPKSRVAWSYPRPLAPYDAIAGWLAFYPGRVARCTVGGVEARPQGGMYGGWVTPDLAGPIKGGPGTQGW